MAIVPIGIAAEGIRKLHTWTEEVFEAFRLYQCEAIAVGSGDQGIKAFGGALRLCTDAGISDRGSNSTIFIAYAPVIVGEGHDKPGMEAREEILFPHLIDPYCDADTVKGIESHWIFDVLSVPKTRNK